MTEFELARPNHAEILEKIDNGEIDKDDLLNEILNYFSDDAIGDFFESFKRDYEID